VRKPGAEARPALAPAGGPGGAPVKVTDFAKEAAGKSGGFAGERDRREAEKLAGVKAGDDKGETKALGAAKMKKDGFDEARRFLASGDKGKVQAGRLGVDLALEMNNLRNQDRLERKALRNVAGRNCIEIGGVWIDEGFDVKKPTVTVKAMSDAYFRILERQPQGKEVFQLGNYLIWVTPNGTNLVIH